MSVFCCDSKTGCPVAALIASALLGVIAAFLRITGVITVTSEFLWVVFGIAIVYLATALIVAAQVSRYGSCNDISVALSTLLAGILGTVLLSVILLAVDFVATSVIGAIITGALLFFFFLTVTATACLVRNLALCNKG